MVRNVVSSAQPTFVHAFSQPHGEADFFPGGGRLVFGLNEPRGMGHIDVFLVCTPAATVLETRPKKEATLHE